jgi:hypothetical protein
MMLNWKLSNHVIKLIIIQSYARWKIVILLIFMCPIYEYSAWGQSFTFIDIIRCLDARQDQSL